MRIWAMLSLMAFSILAIAGCHRECNMCKAKETCESTPTKIVVIGDSTVATNPEDAPQAGWGQLLGDHFRPWCKVVNLARNGRSSRSYVSEGLWAKALAEKPNYVFVQFGHNDQPGKGADRETDPATSYKELLRKYIDESAAIGAKVVLVSSMERRHFDDKGHIKQSLKPWADAVKEVGKEKGVFVIDLHSYSVNYLEELGDAKSLYLSVSDKDRTHWSKAGAKVWADYIAMQLRTAGPEYTSLKACLKPEE
jgi:lysophospholipase L1-like esterase